MVFCDCTEVDRAGGKHSEGILTMAILVSTLLLLCKGFHWICFFWGVNFNNGIGNAYLCYLDIYYLDCSLHFLYWPLCIIGWMLWYQVANNAISIFPFLGFEQILSLSVICVLQSKNIVFCRRSRTSSPIGIYFLLILSRYKKLSYCLQISFLSKECICLISACNFGL